jgi:hypothetical protein
MIRRKLLIATAIIASIVISACSDTTAPETLVPRVLPALAILAPQSDPALLVAPGSAEAPSPCEAGALNMLHDPTMFTIPMARNAPQGNAGMFHAVAVSGC